MHAHGRSLRLRGDAGSGCGRKHRRAGDGADHADDDQQSGQDVGHIGSPSRPFRPLVDRGFRALSLHQCCVDYCVERSILRRSSSSTASRNQMPCARAGTNPMTDRTFGAFFAARCSGGTRGCYAFSFEGSSPRISAMSFGTDRGK